MSIAISYFYWYYLKAPKEIIRIVKGYVRYWIFFFSIKQTMKSYFSPWKMMDATEQGSMLNAMIQTTINSVIARGIGIMMRTFLLSFFLLLEVITLFVGISFFVVWIFLPIVLFIIIIYSFSQINV